MRQLTDELLNQLYDYMKKDYPPSVYEKWWIDGKGPTVKEIIDLMNIPDALYAVEGNFVFWENVDEKLKNHTPLTVFRFKEYLTGKDMGYGLMGTSLGGTFNAWNMSRDYGEDLLEQQGYYDK